MNTTNCIKLGITLIGVLALIVSPARADTFGFTGNEFTVDFVNVGNPGNADDPATPSNGYGLRFGGVPYTYRMGTYQISQDQINKAGVPFISAGAWTGSQPAANINWYNAAAFVNWLNTSTGHVAAYQLDTGATALTLWSSAQAWQAGGENLYRNKDAYYFLPSEDEWYKAAYHKNDGVTADYWLYATGSNTIPTAVASGTTPGTAVYNGVASAPAAVNNDGGLSPSGTMGQSGNVWEWEESSYDGRNNVSSLNRLVGGAAAFSTAYGGLPDSGIRRDFQPSDRDIRIGFRVASVPEPSAALLLLSSGLAGLLRRRRRKPTAFFSYHSLFRNAVSERTQS